MSYLLEFIAAVKLGFYIATATLAIGLQSALGLLGVDVNLPMVSRPEGTLSVQNSTSDMATSTKTIPSSSSSTLSLQPGVAPVATGGASLPKSLPVVVDAPTTPAKPVVAAPAVTVTPLPIKKPITATPETGSTQPILDAEALNATVRGAIVNIYCITRGGGYLHPISGSGVMIDTRGVVLTNAHVAQYLLLKDYPAEDNIQCTIRTGAPARNTYTARLLYLPPQWLAENARQITVETPLGTGEHDYAFLMITGATNGSSTPSSVAALPMSANEPSESDQVLLAAYPAGFLSGQSIQSDLYMSSALSTVKKLYSFNGGETVEAFSLGGSVVAQSGSSGGAVVEMRNGRLIGLISTEINADSTSERDLRAISVKHIDQSLAKVGLGGITGLLTGDIAAQANTFNAQTAPALTQMLVEALKKTQP